MSNETQNTEKNVLLGQLTYLPYKSKGFGHRVGPVFSTSRDDCQSLVPENVPLKLIQDMQDGNLGSFFLWKTKEKEVSA